MILNVYKEPFMTSRDVVNIISKHFKTKKVGHTGTLDPIASGVLVICTKEDTKLVEVLTSSSKEYIATIKLGIKTDTMDITGKVIEEKNYDFTKDKLTIILKSFLGKSIQTVPKYSAVKINGKKLYEYARNNIEIELPKRNIEIYDIELLEYNNDIIKFRVVVSKGTYIRSLIDDICTKLNTVGTMQDLIRTKQGNFSIVDSNKLDDIVNDKYTLIDYKTLFKDYRIIELDYNDYIKVFNGCKMHFDCNEEKVVLTYKNNFVAIYKLDNGIYRMLKYLINRNK